MAACSYGGAGIPDTAGKGDLTMLKWILGILFIVGGIAWAALYLLAAGMADRQVNPSEIIVPLATGGIVAAIGVVILLFG